MPDLPAPFLQPQQQDVDDDHPPPLRPITSLIMKKFSFLLPSKKPKPKSSAASSPAAPPKLLPHPPAASLSTAIAIAAAAPATAAGPTTSDLDLLLAQAEATLGELLARAGASFEAQSSAFALPDQQPSTAPDLRSHTESRGHPSHPEEDMKSALISSGSRSAKFSSDGHGRKRSLSRVWQHLGGNLFCGSGHMSSYVMDQEKIAPVAPSTDAYDHDGLLDETYWQSLADSIISQKREQQQQQQQQKMEVKLAANDSTGHSPIGCESIELSCLRTAKEELVMQNDEAPREVRYAEDMQQETDRESEIVQLIDGDDGRSGKNLMYAESREVLGCTRSNARLNTTLEESPNLAYNYHSMIRVGGSSSSSNLLHPYRFPDANSRYEVDSTSCSSSSCAVQPLERLLRDQTAATQISAGKLTGPSIMSTSSRSTPAINCLQDQPTGSELSATSSCRVSLMTLLHEEAAAADIAAAAIADQSRQEMEEEAATAAMDQIMDDEESKRATSMRRATLQAAPAGEDSMLCCVCMIRRKGAALIPCGHTFCRTCSKQLFTGRGACPLCNNLIVQVLDIF